MIRNLSRRSLLEWAASFAVSFTAMIGLSFKARAQVSEAEKISQAEAKYQSTSNGQQRCEICLQFEPPDHCKIVRSPISANGWCQYFAARENAH